jgi:hypothetical protein
MEPVVYRLRIAVIVCLACASSDAWAQPVGQDREIDRWQIGAGFLDAGAIGEFDTFVPDAILGVLGHVNRSLGHSIFSLGAELAWNQYGSETRSLLLGPLVPEVPNASLEVHTYNAMVGLHGRLRAQLPRGRYRPYVDGLFGFTNLYTTSEVKGEDGCDEGCVFDSESQSSDFVLSYGGGAGIMINFTSRERVPRLDVAMRYLRGGRADYLTEGSLRMEGGQVIREFSRSRTDRFGVYIGVVFGR